MVRLLIQTGRPPAGADAADLDELAAAFRRYAEAKGNAAAGRTTGDWLAAAHRVLFHLGILDAPPEDPRRRPGLAGHYSGVRRAAARTVPGLLHPGRRDPGPGHGEVDRQPPGRVRPVPRQPATRR